MRSWFVSGNLSVQHALRHGALRLSHRADLQESAVRDAQQLLEIATGLNRVAMLSAPGRLLTADQQTRFEALLGERLQAVPMQYLRGSQEFYGRDFAVNSAVLIPRPETELLVDAALEIFTDPTYPLHLADVGTGSGILAVTLALQYPQSTVVALDISAAALDVARANAVSHGLDRRMLGGGIRFLESDLLAAAQGERFDLIVSNPPYIPRSDGPTLHPQVREYEPHLALFGGDDGYDTLRRLLPQAWNCLVPGGWLLLETAGRTPLLEELLDRWTDVRFLRDLQGIERSAVARRSAA